jgi:hypothetical protein
MIRKAIVIIFILFIIAIGVAIYFWRQTSVARDLMIDLDVPIEQISLGVPFRFGVNISNDSNSILQDVKLTITLPEGIVFVGSSPEKTTDYKNLGNLGVGSLTKEEFKLMAISGEKTIKKIKTSVNYLPSAIGSRFEKSTEVNLNLGRAAISLDLAMPKKVFSGEEFEIRVSAKNVSAVDFSDLILKIEYPPTFSFRDSTLKPDFDNNTWELGGLLKNSETSLSIFGNVIGPDNAFFDFKADLETDFLGISYLIGSLSGVVSISPSPLSIAINLNEDPDYITVFDDELNYALTYTNNTDIGLKDVVITAQLIGEMFDFRTLITDASFRSSDQTLIWNAANTPSLALLSPGDSGLIEFRLKTKSNYPIKRLSDKDFVLKIDSRIESPTVPYYVTAEKTVGLAKLETKVSGYVSIETKGFFRDAPAKILNKGPFPPQVGKPTNYTIHWLITNYSTDVSNVEVRAFLGGNVKSTGIIKSNIPSLPVYNERTQEMVWQIDRIPATKGVINKPIEAIFQVEATPSLADVGSYLTLIQPTSLKATDLFTGLDLGSSDEEVTTNLPDDPSVAGQFGVVSE